MFFWNSLAVCSIKCWQFDFWFFCFSKPSLYTWKFSVHILLKPCLKDFECNVASMGSEGNCQVVSTFFSTTLLGTEMKIDPFQSCGYYCTSQICWHTEYSTLTSLSFSTLNCSPGIPSLPLAFWVVMLPKTHLTSHSRMSGSEWMATLSWLFRPSGRFLCSSSLYSFHLFLISFASVKSLPFSSFYHAHPCMKCSFAISKFVEIISSLSCSIFFSMH